jgi:radical SAM protein with 4Fe4S-binding SPASM domain
VALRQKKLPIQNFDGLEQIIDVKTINDWSQPRYCAVSAGVHCAVDSRGDLYECLEEAGDRARRIGTLSGGKIEYFELKDAYQKRQLENRPECLRCSIALFCGGGCISQKRTQGGSLTKQFCRQNIVFVGQTLRAGYLQRQAAKAVAGCC